MTGRGNPRLRLLDRTVAVALLWVIGMFRRSRARPERPVRIGVMKTAGIGDMVLAMPAIGDLIAAFPAAEVVVLAGPDNAAVAGMIPGARVMVLSVPRPWETIRRLRQERLEVLLDLGQWTRVEALYAALSGAAWTAGFRTAGQRRHYAYDRTVPHSDLVREVDNYRELVGELGVRSAASPALAPAGGIEPPVEGDYVVFHLWPGGFRSELREWPLERWRGLAEAITARGVAVVLSGGPDDSARNEAFRGSLAARADRVVNIAGRYRIAELVDVLAGARCVVSVNTGVMHMAAAAGAPTVALNGPTSSRRWGAMGETAVNLDSELPGCGFLNLGFEYDGHRTDCMEGISLERVVQATLERLP